MAATPASASRPGQSRLRFNPHSDSRHRPPRSIVEVLVHRRRGGIGGRLRSAPHEPRPARRVVVDHRATPSPRVARLVVTTWYSPAHSGRRVPPPAAARSASRSRAGLEAREGQSQGPQGDQHRGSNTTRATTDSHATAGGRRCDASFRVASAAHDAPNPRIVGVAATVIIEGQAEAHDVEEVDADHRHRDAWNEADAASPRRPGGDGTQGRQPGYVPRTQAEADGPRRKFCRGWSGTARAIRPRRRPRP